MLKLFQITRIRHSFMNVRGIKMVSVIGSGLMGSGIAQVCAQEGFNVSIMDTDNNKIIYSKSVIEKNMSRIGHKKFPDDNQSLKFFINDCMSNIQFTCDMNTGVVNADLVIEAVIENLDLKRDIFSKIEKMVQPSCILASNTSSLSLHDISSVIQNKDRFGGFHFFNPVSIMKLVEIVRTKHTSDSTFQELTKFAKSIKKIPVTCSDTPGFICNRLLVPYLAEAIRLLNRSDATAKDIDTTMKLGAGHPMGPLELSDLIGLDTIKFVLDSFNSKYPNDSLFRCPENLSELVSLGKLGRKTGEGFYKYDSQGKILS